MDSIEEYGYELNCLLKQVREFRRSDIKGQMIAIRTDSNGKKYTEVLAERIFKADSDVESSDDSYDIIEDVKSDKIKSGNALNINDIIGNRNPNINGETINSHSNINQNINERNSNIDGETINSHSNINQNINERNSNIDGETINSHSNINQNINERNSNINDEITDGHQNINGRILKPKSNNNKSRQAIPKLPPNFIQVNRVNIQFSPAPALPQQRQQQSLQTQALPKQQPHITDNLSFDNFINPQIIIDNAKVYQSISDKRSQYNLSKTICEQCVANYNILNKDDKEAQRIKISDILRTYHTFSISDSDKLAYRKTIYPQGIPLRFERYYCKNDHLELHYYCAKRKMWLFTKLYHYFQLVRI
ncbi:ABC transporter AbcG-related protein [Trichomonas vaginalis G3]|uniref:ABC transporter AbcG-related protein n=1 Tax=Trichomonas vaginalis (strain ATCC PRA-98 / G3) TaxID=412133 RepID=A2GJB6_TRIV3|nr:ABC transporter AbcG-related protein [Trichomonas vaginalis G3]|eukprot:XP_001295681.1 ABC transporter AbcG-related protein [Trichomonas vaginalis G3]